MTEPVSNQRQTPSKSAVRSYVKLLLDLGYELGGIKIEGENFTVFTKADEVKGNAYDAWKAEQNSDRSARR